MMTSALSHMRLGQNVLWIFGHYMQYHTMELEVHFQGSSDCQIWQPSGTPWTFSTATPCIGKRFKRHKRQRREDLNWFIRLFCHLFLTWRCIVVDCAGGYDPKQLWCKCRNDAHGRFRGLCNPATMFYKYGQTALAHHLKRSLHRGLKDVMQLMMSSSHHMWPTAVHVRLCHKGEISVH